MVKTRTHATPFFNFGPCLPLDLCKACHSCQRGTLPQQAASIAPAAQNARVTAVQHSKDHLRECVVKLTILHCTLL